MIKVLMKDTRKTLERIRFSVQTTLWERLLLLESHLCLLKRILGAVPEKLFISCSRRIFDDSLCVRLFSQYLHKEIAYCLFKQTLIVR